MRASYAGWENAAQQEVKHRVRVLFHFVFALKCVHNNPTLHSLTLILSPCFYVLFIFRTISGLNIIEYYHLKKKEKKSQKKI